MPLKSKLDWEIIENEYRAGQLSVQAIAKMHGIGPRAIVRRAGRKGWLRDLTEKVSNEIRSRLTYADGQPLNAEDEAIEMAATRGILIIQDHRKNIQKAKEILMVLFQELGDITHNRETIEDMINQSDASQRHQQIMKRAISFSSRSSAMRDLAISARTLIELERNAFNLNNTTEDKLLPPQLVINFAQDQEPDADTTEDMDAHTIDLTADHTPSNGHDNDKDNS